MSCIIESAEALKNRRHIKFVFLGDVRARFSLEKYASEHELLGKTVFFSGRFPIESIPYFMGRADVLLVSLKDEEIFNLTVPSKVQFYMAQGKPILAMLNGDGAELIKEADCGRSVPAGDSESFTDMILELEAMTAEKLRRIGENGSKYYEAHFRKEQRISQLDGIIKAVCRHE